MKVEVKMKVDTELVTAKMQPWEGSDQNSGQCWMNKKDGEGVNCGLYYTKGREAQQQ